MPFALQWFNELQTGRMLTLRDLLSWVAFIKVTKKSLQPEFAFIHGSFLVLLDGITLGTSFPFLVARSFTSTATC